MGKTSCEIDGKGNWEDGEGFYGTCWNISEETCKEIGGARELSSWNGLPTCVLDLFKK